MASRVKRRGSSGIVPRAVFATAVVAVVPACARNAGQGSAAQPAAIVARDAGAADVTHVPVDAAGRADVASAADGGIDVVTGDATSSVSPGAAVAHDAGSVANEAIDAGAPIRRRRRETPVATEPPRIDRFRLYGVARSTFENDPRHHGTE